MYAELFRGFFGNIRRVSRRKWILESFRFEDENEDEDEDEAPGFRHKEIFKLFRLQLGRDNVVAINFVVPAKLKTKKFEDFVVVKTESFVLVLDFVLVLESKALYCMLISIFLARDLSSSPAVVCLFMFILFVVSFRCFQFELHKNLVIWVEFGVD